MKVFLSSTYLDLIEHRKEAAEALARLGHHVIGMETFNARTEDPTKASLSEVDECNFLLEFTRIAMVRSSKMQAYL